MAYQAALLGQTATIRNPLAKAEHGTIAAVIASYLKSPNYIGLRKTSKVGYLTRLETLRVEHGHRTVAGLSRSRIITAFLQPLADRPGAALDTLKKLRILIRHADLLLLLFGADREAPVGERCVALSISRKCRKELLAEDYPPSAVDRAARITAVESPDGEIVTVLRPRGPRGKRYRKAFHNHRPKMLKSA